MRAWLSPLRLIGIIVLLGGCSQEPQTGAVEVRWHRDVCNRCSMAISDVHYAAQIRLPPSSNLAQVFKFDDFGCAVIWLEDKPWKNDPDTEFWVADFRSGNWLDARSAWYVSERVTPMNYGLGAQSERTVGALDFATARAQVIEIENTFNVHSGRHVLFNKHLHKSHE